MTTDLVQRERIINQTAIKHGQLHVPVYWHISVWEYLAVVFPPPNSPVLCALLSDVLYLYYQSWRLQLPWKEQKGCLISLHQLNKLEQVALPPNSTYFESLFISSLGSWTSNGANWKFDLSRVIMGNVIPDLIWIISCTLFQPNIIVAHFRFYFISNNLLLH